MEIKSTNSATPTSRRRFLKIAGGIAVTGVWASSSSLRAFAQENPQKHFKPALVEGARIEAAITDLRQKKLSCAQATFLGVCKTVGESLAEEQLLALSAGFAGGIGRTFNDGTCGALVAGVMAVGLYLPDQTDKAISVSKQLFEQFKIRENTVRCKDILQKKRRFFRLYQLLFARWA